MRIAFIIQRYGTEILGGSEYSCRLVAERMAEHHKVDVLTTCARDYVTWRNDYPEGQDRVRGVTVRRFANAETRDIAAFDRYSDWIFNYPHTHEDELTWLRRQGPWCPALVDHLERHHQQYDVLIFFTYLYAPTVLGLQVAPQKSILVPTAHDEPAIRLDIFRDLFSLPAGLAYHTDVERRFVQSTFPVHAVAEETVGCGVDVLPDQPPLPAGGPRDVENLTGDHDERDDDASSGRFRRGPRGSVFRRRHRLHGPLVLFGGRIERGKGCEELFDYFSSTSSRAGKPRWC